VVTLLVLFARTGSPGEVAVAVATSAKLPFVVGLIVSVTVAVAPRASVPRLHVTSCFFGLGSQEP
jgi:hypothetical protein